MTRWPKKQVKEIERIVGHLNENWVTKQFDKLEQYFFHRAVMIEPGTRQHAAGAPNIIKNYLDFIEEAEVFDYSITKLLVDQYEETAIAHFTYRLKYRVEDTKYDESNTERLVFGKHNGNWQII